MATKIAKLEITQTTVAEPRKRIQLASIATKPKLVSIILDDEAVLEELGGELEFFVLDRYPVAQFMEFMKIAEKAGVDEDARNKAIAMVMPMMLDENGNPINTEEQFLDPIITLSAIHKVMEHLGNLSARSQIGTRQK